MTSSGSRMLWGMPSAASVRRLVDGDPDRLRDHLADGHPDGGQAGHAHARERDVVEARDRHVARHREPPVVGAPEGPDREHIRGRDHGRGRSLERHQRAEGLCPCLELVGDRHHVPVRQVQAMARDMGPEGLLPLPDVTQAPAADERDASMPEAAHVVEHHLDPGAIVHGHGRQPCRA